MIDLVNFNQDMSMIQNRLNRLKNTPIAKIIKISEDRFHCYNIEGAMLGCIKYDAWDSSSLAFGDNMEYDPKWLKALCPGHEDDLVLGYKDTEVYSHIMRDISDKDAAFIEIVKAISRFYTCRKPQLNSCCAKLSEAKDNKCMNCYLANRCYGKYINNGMPGYYK